MCSIRKVRESEYPALVHIWDKAVGATHDFLAESDFEHIKSRLTGYFDHVDLYAYTIGAGIDGFLGVSADNIEMLFVSERGRGMGTSLLDFATGELEIHKVDVNLHNTAALEFYRKYGFREISRSEFDSQGLPYPIVHMALDPAPGAK